MTSEMLMLIYCSLLILILILGFIAGVIHGRRKATYKLITTILFYVIFFLIIDVVAGKLINLPILNYLRQFNVNIPPLFDGCATIKEACVAYLLEMELTSDQIINTVMSFSTVVAKILFTIIYFIVIGLFYCLIVNLIYLFFIRRKKARLNKVKQKDNKKVKLNEHRLTGGFLGFFKKVPQVFVIIAITTGIITLIPSISKGNNEGKLYLTTDIESDHLTELIEKYKLEEYVKFIDMYRNSPFVKVLGGDSKENNKISGFIFDKMTQGTYNDYTLDLQSEMAFLISTGAKVFSITEGKFKIEELSKDQQMEMCALLKDLRDSNMLMDLLPVGATVALSLQQVKDFINQKLPGFEVDPKFLNDIDWENDIVEISDAAMSLVDISDGFQNLNKIDFLHMEPEKVKTLMKSASNINLLLYLIQDVVDYLVKLPEIIEKIGDLSEEIKGVIWSDEIVHVGNIYEDFHKLGLETLDNLLGDLTAPIVPGQPDKLDLSQELVTTVFESTFISKIFPIVLELAVKDQDEAVKQLFNGLEISEWDYELNTIIDVAREVRDNGGTITKLDLEIVRNVQVETILRSEVLTQAFTDILINWEQEGSIGQSLGLAPVLYIPKDYRNVANKKDNLWFKKATLVVDEKGEPILDVNGHKQYNIEKRELYHILKAFQAILPKEGPIDFNLLPQYLLNLEDKYLQNDDKSIFTSKVLRTSISNFVQTDAEISKFMIIPLNACEKVDDIYSIKKEELNNMIKGAKALGIEDFNNFVINYETFVHLKENYIPNGSEPEVSVDMTNLDMILSSKIVHSTFSNFICNLSNSEVQTFSIPSEVKEQITTVQEDKQYYNITKTEINAIVDALLVFENIDYNDPAIDINTLLSVYYEGDKFNEAMGDKDVATIANSKILNYTVKDILSNQNEIIVPTYAISNDYLNTKELQNVVKGVIALDIKDFNNIVIDNTTIQNLENQFQNTNLLNIDVVLSSDIVHATLGNKINELINNSNNQITLPLINNKSSKYYTIDIIDIYKKENKLNLITRDEIKHAIHAFNMLNLDFNNPSLDVNVIFNFTNEEVDEFLSSHIINATLTTNLINKSNEVKELVLPKVSFEKENNDLFIKANEVYDTINGFNILLKDKPDDVIDLNNIHISNETIKRLEQIDPLTNKPYLDTILRSDIAYATLSKVIFNNLENSILTIYDEDVKIFGNIDINEVKYELIKEEELNHLVAIFNMLNIDISNPHFDINTLLTLTDEEIEKVGSSYIINATITKELINLASSNNSFIMIPKSALIDNNKYISYTLNGEHELINMINAIECFNIEDLNNIVITDDIIKDLNSQNEEGIVKLDIVLKSSILHASLSKEILMIEKNNPDTFIVPENVKEEVVLYDDSIATNIKKEEMKALISAISNLSLDLVGGPTYNPQMIFNNINHLDEALNSSILYASLSNNISNIKELKIDSFVKENNYIKKNEIKNFVISLNSLFKDLTSFDHINITPETLQSLTKSELDVIFNSDIIRSTSTSLIPQTLSLPIDTIDNNFKDYQTLNKIDLIEFVYALGINGLNLTDFDPNISSTFDKDFMNKIDVVLTSKVLKHKITNIILTIDNLVFIDDVKSTIFESYNDDTYLKNSEIINLLNFANGLNLDSLTFNIEDVLLNNNLQTQFKDSLILKASITKAALDYKIGNVSIFDENDPNYFEKLTEYKTNIKVSVCKDAVFDKKLGI